MLYVLTALKCEAAALEGLPGKHVVTGVGSFALKAIENIAKFHYRLPNEDELRAGWRNE